MIYVMEMGTMSLCDEITKKMSPLIAQNRFEFQALLQVREVRSSDLWNMFVRFGIWLLVGSVRWILLNFIWSNDPLKKLNIFRTFVTECVHLDGYTNNEDWYKFDWTIPNNAPIIFAWPGNKNVFWFAPPPSHPIYLYSIPLLSFHKIPVSMKGDSMKWIWRLFLNLHLVV